MVVAVEPIAPAAPGTPGPKTEQGKSTVSQNAIKHGLSGKGLKLPESEAEQAAQRERDFIRELSPRNPFELELVKEMAVHSVRWETAYHLQVRARSRAVDRARDYWREDQRDKVLRIVAKLRSNPEHYIRQIQREVEGIAWIIERWKMLRDAADSEHGWNDEQQTLALDLLGIPEVFRDLPHKQVTSKDPVERRRIQLELADEQIALMEADHLPKAVRFDDANRKDVLEGYEVATDRETQLFRRYERDARRHYLNAWNELRRIRKADEKLDAFLDQAMTKQITPYYSTLQTYPGLAEVLKAQEQTLARFEAGLSKLYEEEVAPLLNPKSPIPSIAPIERISPIPPIPPIAPIDPLNPKPASPAAPHESRPTPPERKGNRQYRRRMEALERKKARQNRENA